MSAATGHWWDKVQGESALGLLKRLASTARHTLFGEPKAPWMLKKLEVDRRFDARFAVETGGVTHLSALHITGNNRRLGVDHIASDPDELEHALDSLPSDLSGLTFVDLGSGKGRAVLVASQRPFRRIVGVEFAPKLHQAARANVARFPRSAQRCERIELVCADAVNYELPDEDLVIFMYNPFGLEVMRTIAAGARASLRARPRRMYVLYTNPFYAEVWTALGFQPLARGDNFALLTEPLPDGEARERPPGP
jgi:SAM-dependent methyltransferase